MIGPATHRADAPDVGPAGPDPRHDLDDALRTVAEATERFLNDVAALTDDDVAGATRIPPWTRGHVVTHVARAADSYCRLLAGAVEGHEVPQYASMAFRAEQIEAGARRPVAELVGDVREASTAFADTIRDLPGHAWAAHVRMRPGELRAPAALPWIRLREIEVHHVDLDVGYGFADIPTDTAGWIVDDILFELGRRDPVPAVHLLAEDADLHRRLGPPTPCLRGTQAALLAWLSGRSSGDDLVRDESAALEDAPYWI